MKITTYLMTNSCRNPRNSEGFSYFFLQLYIFRLSKTDIYISHLLNLMYLFISVHLLALRDILTVFFLPLSCVNFLSVCHRGFFNCSYSPCPAVCTAYSDRHYHTFDGLEYDYYSDCQVYLLKVSLNEHSFIFICVNCWNSNRLCI